MSLIVLKHDYEAAIPHGTMIVLNQITGKAVVYDSLVHALSQVIGVVYPKLGTQGRICANLDGLVFQDVDYPVYGEDFVPLEPLIENPNYGPFNPFVDDDVCIVAMVGMAPVLHDNIVNKPSTWVLLREGTTYDAYYIK